MTLAEASAGFLAFVRHSETGIFERSAGLHETVLKLLAEYYPRNTAVNDITPTSLRDFIARWYLERACTLGSSKGKPQRDNSPADATKSQGSDGDSGAQPAAIAITPFPRELLDSLSQFLSWIDTRADTNLAQQSSPILLELSGPLPRAVEITADLSSWLRERGGAFGFPEFLTSFEEGGHSEYDIDTPGNVGALEGYFRILRVEGVSVEAEELISEERVWPILFPPEVSSLLDDQYIINLELVRTSGGWQIAGCGFAYPPGTDV